jgi:hypothetical protein
VPPTESVVGCKSGFLIRFLLVLIVWWRVGWKREVGEDGKKGNAGNEMRHALSATPAFEEDRPDILFGFAETIFEIFLKSFASWSLRVSDEMDIVEKEVSLSK